MKRIFSFILVSIMLLGCLAVSTSAYEVSNGMYREHITGITWGDTSPFRDVNDNKWYYNSVKEITELGVMKGISEEWFAPDEKLTRGMLVTVLARYQMLVSSMGLGGGLIYNEQFSDVKKEDWYGIYVCWASDHGYIKGYPDGTFRPNDPVTREDAATMLFRYARYLGAYVLSENKLTDFSDSGKVSDYAYESLELLYRAGVLNGKSVTRIAPKANITRAEAAKLILAIHNSVKTHSDVLDSSIADISYKLDKTTVGKGGTVTIETTVTNKVSYFFWGSMESYYLSPRIHRTFDDGSATYLGSRIIEPKTIYNTVKLMIINKGSTYTAKYEVDDFDRRGVYDLSLSFELGHVDLEDVVTVQ